MRCRTRLALLLALSILMLMTSMSVATAQHENVGILRLADVKHSRQAAPSGQVAFTIDAEYAVLFNATIRSSLFAGTIGNLGPEVWRSEPAIVGGGGDELWSFNLTAPSQEGSWPLTAFVYYQEDGQWKYYNDSFHGPGYAEVSVKVARLAGLEIDLSVPNVPVTVNGATSQTSLQGSVVLQLPVGQAYSISVPSPLQSGSSTRIVFLGWQDGNNDTLRSLFLDGDSKIVGSYKTQYALHVNSPVSQYSYSAWYDSGSVVTLRADNSASASWPFNLLGLRYNFHGWSGDMDSNANQINVTMEKPLMVNANFVLDYATLIFPAIVGVGLVGGTLLSILRRRRDRHAVAEKATEEEAAKICANCGEPVEESWAHCDRCGKALGSPEAVKS